MSTEPVSSGSDSRRRRRAGSWCLLTLLAHAALPAQRGRVVGLVRDDHGHPVVDAQVAWRSHGLLGLHCLDDVAEPRHGETATDPRGVFTVDSDEPVGAWLRNASAGAVVLGAAPGAPGPVRLEPLVPLDLGADAQGAWLARQGVYLGHLEGRVVGVPPGTYDVLVEHPRAWFVATCAVSPGQAQTLVRPTGRGAKLALPATAMARVQPFVTAELPREPGGAVILPAAEHPLQVLVWRDAAGRQVLDEVWAPPASDLAAPEPAVTWRRVRIEDPHGAPVTGALAVTVARSGDVWRGRAACRSDAAGDAVARVLDDAVLVVAAPPFAVAAVRVVDLEATLRLRAGTELHLRLSDRLGAPVAGARLTLAAGAVGPTREYATNARGEIEVACLPHSVQVHVDHPSFLARTLQLDVREGPMHEITLAEGRSIRGTILVGDKAWPGVSIVVRDPTSTLDVGARSTVTAEDGSFTVGGLPDGVYTVFARCDVGGYTWSGQRTQVVAGTEDLRLVIACEDPPLPDAGARRPPDASQRLPEARPGGKWPVPVK